MGTASLDVRVLRIATPSSRVGFVVPKYGYSAVRRNQLKRRLRELTRAGILPALRATGDTVSLDVLIRTRPSAYNASLESLRAECATLKRRLLRLRTTSSADLSSRTESSSAP